MNQSAGKQVKKVKFAYLRRSKIVVNQHKFVYKSAYMLFKTSIDSKKSLVVQKHCFR